MATPARFVSLRLAHVATCCSFPVIFQEAAHAFLQEALPLAAKSGDVSGDPGQNATTLHDVELRVLRSHLELLRDKLLGYYETRDQHEESVQRPLSTNHFPAPKWFDDQNTDTNGEHENSARKILRHLPLASVPDGNYCMQILHYPSKLWQIGRRTAMATGATGGSCVVFLENDRKNVIGPQMLESVREKHVLEAQPDFSPCGENTTWHQFAWDQKMSTRVILAEEQSFSNTENRNDNSEKNAPPSRSFQLCVFRGNSLWGSTAFSVVSGDVVESRSARRGISEVDHRLGSLPSFALFNMDEVPPEEGVFNRSEPQEQLPAFVLILSNLTHAAEFAIHYRSYYANPPGGEVEVPSRTVNDGSTKRLIASYWEEINFASEAALPLDHAKERRKKQVNSKARSATSTSTIDARHDKNLQRSYTVVPHPSRSYGQLFTTGTQLVVANTEWAAVLVEDEEAKGLHDTNAEESPTFNISGKDSSQTQDVEKIAVGPLYDFGVPVLKFHHLGVRDRYVAVLGNGTIATCSIRVTTTDGFPQLRVTASLDMFAERQESVVPSAARAAAHDAANVIGEKTAFSRLCRKSTSSLARRTSPTVVVEIINLDETSFGVVARAAIEQTAAESDEEQNPCWRLLFVSTAAAWKLHGAELIVPFASWLPGGLVAAQPAILKLRDKNDKHKTRGAGAHNGLQIWSLFADIASAGEGSRKGAGQDSATLSSHTYRVAIPYLNQRSAAWSWEFWQVDLNALQEKAQAILQAKEEFKIDNEKNEAPGDDDTFVEQISNISSRATLAAGGASDEGTENTLPARSEAVLQLDAAAAPAATDDLLSTLSEIVFDNQPPFRNFVWLFDKNHSWLAWYAYEYDGEIFSIILIAAGTFVYMRLWQNGKEDSGPAVDPRVWEDPCWNDPKKFRELYDAILSGVKESQDTDQAMSSPGGGCSAGATNGLRPF